MLKLHKPLQIATTAIIVSTWLINGLLCKVLNFVPRHELIVASIVGPEHALLFTKTIGLLEIAMVVWILSGIKSRYCAVFQMVIVATMNILEFILVPGLLLFGKYNIVFAFLFIALIYFNGFVLRNKQSTLEVNT